METNLVAKGNATAEADLWSVVDENKLIKSFMEKHEIPRGVGGTPLAGELGIFPLSDKLIECFESEEFGFHKEENNAIKIWDTAQGGIATRKMSARQTGPMLWVWPSIAIDYDQKRLVCALTFRTGCGETFPMSWSERLCRGMALANMGHCHSIIGETGKSGLFSESWHDLGYGQLIPLSEIFDEFVDKYPSRRLLAYACPGIFKPSPLMPWFIKASENHVRCALNKKWRKQRDELKARL